LPQRTRRGKDRSEEEQKSRREEKDKKKRKQYRFPTQWGFVFFVVEIF
jgi:hypothetical protein